VLSRSLFALAAALWLTVAALTGTRAISVGHVSPHQTAILAAIMSMAALVMAALATWSLRGNPWVDAFAVCAAAVNVLLTFTDQVGVYDVMYLVFSLVLLMTLLWALPASCALRRRGDK